MTGAKEAVQFLKILADESRLRIINMLNQQAMSVSDICSALDMNQSAVSKHLVKLRLLGIVKDVRSGSFIIYSLTDQKDVYVKMIRFILKQVSLFEPFVSDIKKIVELGKK